MESKSENQRNQEQKAPRAENKARKYGEVILLPTLVYPEAQRPSVFGQLLQFGFKEGRVETFQKSPQGIMLNEEDLKTVSETYERTRGRPLVHIYASNSQKAVLPPSQISKTRREGGQAEFYQGWQDKPGREPKDGKLWLNVASIPTTDKPGPDGKIPPDNEMIHYFAQLYYYLAQGKSICLPVRPFNKDYRHFKAPYDKKDPALPGIYQPTTNGYTQIHEYSFGGGNVQEFEKNYPALEAALTQLQYVANLLQRHKPQSETELNEIIKCIPTWAKEAFKKGLNETDEVLNDDILPTLQRKYLGAVPEKKVKFETVDAILQKIDEAKFKEYLKAKKCEVKIDNEKQATITVNSDAKAEKIKFRKKEDNRVEAEANNPTPHTLEVMADVMRQALGPKTKVKIIVESSDPNSVEVKKLKDDLWLKAMANGLEVEDHLPEDEAVRKKGKTAQASFFQKLGQKQTDQKDDDEEEVKLTRNKK